MEAGAFAVEPDLIAVQARPAAVDHQEIAVGFQYQQRMMPDSGPVIYPLAAVGVKRTQFADKRRFIRCGDDDEPVMILHRDKGLRSQGVAFDHANGNGPRARLSAKNTDQRFAAIGRHVNTGEIVKPLGRAFIDGHSLGAIGLDDVSEGRECFLREGGREQLQRVQGQSSCASVPKTLTRLTPPSGKIFRRICVIGPRFSIAALSKV